MLELPAKPRVFRNSPVTSRRVGPDTTDVGPIVVGVTESPVGGKAFDTWQIGGQWHAHFAEGLTDRLTPARRALGIEPRDIARTEEEVGIELGIGVAML